MSTNTVFVPAAGIGARLRTAPKDFPKPLKTVGDLPAIVRVINSYPDDWQVVVALGHDWEIVKDSLTAIYDNPGKTSRIQFARTDSHQNPLKGLSHTILDSRPLLGDQPFVFHAVDSILDSPFVVTEQLSMRNQVFTANPRIAGKYRFLRRDNGALVWSRGELDGLGSDRAYIGVSHVVDTSLFWASLDKFANARPEDGETLGLWPAQVEEVILQKGVWFDIGTPEGLRDAQVHFVRSANVLEKEVESIWFSGRSVVKAHREAGFISGRVERAQHLYPYVPQTVAVGRHCLKYERIEGTVLSEALNDLNFSRGNFFSFLWAFWTHEGRREVNQEVEYDPNYDRFYRVKTLNRIGDLTQRFPDIGRSAEINGLWVPSLAEQLDKVPWDRLSTIARGRVHGDLHAENILWLGNGSFKLLDWRQDMAGSTGPDGDVYYDFGKLVHGFRVDHSKVTKGDFLLSMSGKELISANISPTKKKCAILDELPSLAESVGLSWDRVSLVEALIYLNIAPLHFPDRYARFLALFGRWRLALVTEES